MRTVSFYSYKGGTGRTLVLANVGVLAARLGLKVVLVDLDLEAPGLPYKFPAETFNGPGVVEWMTVEPRPELDTLLHRAAVPDPFLPNGSLILITASDKPSRRYLQAVRDVQTQSANQAGAALLGLKDAIAADLAPDLLLLDSRTGITTTNAITTRVLADDIAVVTLNTPEQLDGTREVLRSLTPLKRPADEQSPVGLYVLVSRVHRPTEAGAEHEERIRRSVEDFLTEPAVPLATTIAQPRISLLHNDAEIANREDLLMARADGLSSRMLHLDYVEFFDQLLGDQGIKLRDTALGRATSDDQRAAWERFFGLADAVGERGAPARVPDVLVSEIRGARPISKVVAELRRESAHTPVELVNLGRALHEYGSTLHAAGKFEEAEAQLLESDETFARALAADPTVTNQAGDRHASIRSAAVYGRMLALATLSDVYKSENNPSAAVSVLRRAVDIATSDPNRSPNVKALEGQLWAMQGILLTQLGDLSMAADAVERGISVLMPTFGYGRALASWYRPELDPHRHNGQSVAVMLELLATISMRRGDVDTAVDLAQTSVAIRQQYFDEAPTPQNGVGVAKSLNNLGNHLRIARRHDDAEAPFREAVGILRRYAADDSANVELLATALEGLAAALGELGQFNLALSTAEEALHYRRDVVEFGGGELRQRHALASALNNVSTQYGALDRYAESAERAQEAVDLLVATRDSREDLELFAAAQNNLALSSYRAGDMNVALQAALESVRTNEELLDVSPSWQRTQLVRALLNLSLIHHGADHHRDAAIAAQRAAQLARDLSPSDPELYANCLGILTSRLLAAGEPSAATESGREATAETRRLFENGKADAATLATTLNVWASALHANGERDAAADVAAEARRIFSSAVFPIPPET
jgi:tetratricopeptide (TPR) repeat protein/MinD-like ATPase involved in chromosome partitioning or flagellar assembly